MCDYCDCRSITEIGELSDEHERVLAVTHRLRHRADHEADEGESGALLRSLHDLLEPHTEREEAGIFAVLARIDCEPAYRQRFLDDHGDIGRALAAATADRARIPALIALVERHVFDEETDLYPALRQLFAPADWHDVHRRLHRLSTTRAAEPGTAVPTTG